MNPLLVILLGWLMLGLETGLKDTLSVRIGSVAAAPSFVVPLAVFIALSAPPIPALWACVLLGLFLDFTAPQQTATGLLTVAGPHALGLLVAGQFVLLVRPVVIRKHPLTLVVLSMVGAAVASIAVVALLTVRTLLGDAIVYEPTTELLGRLLSAVLTGGTALALSVMFIPLAPILGMPAIQARFGRR
jgi:hypothetical protein